MFSNIWYVYWVSVYGIHVRMDIVVCMLLPLLQWMTAGRGIVHSEMPGGDGDNIAWAATVDQPQRKRKGEMIPLEISFN